MLVVFADHERGTQNQKAWPCYTSTVPYPSPFKNDKLGAKKNSPPFIVTAPANGLV